MFSQYNEEAAHYYQTSNMSPLGWAEKYFFYNGELSTIQRSLASESLIKNVLVNSSDGLLPLITCSKPDLNGRTYGWGNYTRSFSKTAGSVTFTAPETYGIYTFDKWKKTTASGTEEVFLTDITINTTSHTWISANYALNVPDMEVPDTVAVSWNQPSVNITVKNNNFCDHLPMKWFSTCESEWFTIKEGTGKGTEEGTISLVLAQNPGDRREGILHVFAMDASTPQQEVVVIQGMQPSEIHEREKDDAWSIYPNPVRDEIYVAIHSGFLLEVKTITIRGMDGRAIMRMELAHTSREPIMIPVESLPCGVYILELNVNGTRWRKKFIRGD